MKRKTAKDFDSTEFLLLAFVTVTLLSIFAWQMNIAPKFLLFPTILGASAGR